MTATGVSGVTDGGASISSQVDEVFTVEQCLYAIMVASANDIAFADCRACGGSVDKFCTDDEQPCPGAWLHQYRFLPIPPDFPMTISIPQPTIWH